MKEVPRRRNEGTKRTSMHGEDVIRWGVIPMQFPFITYGMELYINDSIPTNTNIEQCMCMRASELRNFGIFTFLNCYFFKYFVGTLKISHGLISLGGGGGASAPKPPPPTSTPVLPCTPWIYFLTYIFVIVIVSSSRILGVPRSNRVPWGSYGRHLGGHLGFS